MKQKFIEWFTKNNNGCSPAMEDDRSFVYEMTQHMFEAYQAGVAEGEARCAALAAELSSVLTDRAVILEDLDNTCFEIGMQRGEKAEAYPTPVVANHDAFLAEVRAQGVDMFALMFAEEAIKSNNITTGWRAKASREASEYAEALREDAAQLRQEAAK
ncbi:hypothetical protein [Enterobacter hormaechei]|uniref:hypothetical protein n=1 Tax=Enterobacter hormaechei TaxID=158836 RepID=UPI0023F9B5CD|nr:hypothetical protein [Enterobacter hormaechei]MDF7702723.1 hypothetical protein [Enterobacter hormaechei subsp. steigerwaltii]